MNFFCKLLAAIIAFNFAHTICFGQFDPIHRNLVELGYDQPLTGRGPQSLYAYYYYNNPDFVNSNVALRAAIAPAYIDSELGFKELISPTTDVGLGIYGGAYGDNYYEIRQGEYLKGESFDGHGGGASLSIYQLLNPGMLIPVNLVARAGARYTFFDGNSDTAGNFTVPEDRITGFVRTGVRVAGKEPILMPDLGLELSAWYERQWRSGTAPFGFNGDRTVSPDSSLYWVYAGLNYTWTNSGNKISFAITAGGSSSADRFSAWRLGGVLPLIAEFPLMIPGYYYQELTAENFVHFYGAYLIPLDREHRFQLMLEGAAARLDYLPGFELPDRWQSGAGVGLSYTPKNQIMRVIVRYGYGFNSVRSSGDGSQSVGILFQFDFEAYKKYRHRNQ